MKRESSTTIDRPRWWRPAAALLGLALTFGGLALGVGPAAAAGYGPGYDNGAGHLGAYSVGGVNVYCLQETAARPTGATDGGNLQGWGAMGPDALAQLDYVFKAYGQSGDANMTSAVAMYTWSVADTASYNSHGMSGDAYFIGRAPSGARAAIRANLAAIRADAARIVASRGQTTGSATLRIDMFNEYDGQVVVATSPASATGTLTLAGATLAGSPANTTPVGNGSVIPIHGAPLDSEGKYSVTANATFSSYVGSGHGGAIMVYSTGSAQRLGGPGPVLPTSINFNASTYVSDPIPLEFAPRVGTRVASKFIEAGQPFCDVVTFGEDADFAPWRRTVSGNYVPITARATVYGPFDAQPAEGATVPDGAPVAGTAALTTTPAAGPTVPYTACTTEVAATSGFHTWVWTISAADQTPFVQGFIPVGYEYADAFGQVEETHISPFSPAGTSQISATELALGAQVTDTLTTSYSGGNWLEDAAGPITVNYRVTAYFVPGDPAVPLAVTTAPPAAAVTLGTQLLPARGVTTLTAAPVTAPTGTLGHVSYQWCVLTADQNAAYKGWTHDWCDQFGLPSESARVDGPEVATKAKSDVVLWTTPAQQAYDVAIVGGVIPADPMSIDFAAFTESYDADGEPVCGVDNLVWESAAPVIVSEAGEYSSESFTPETVVPAELLPDAGSDESLDVWFVESVFSVNDELLAVGQCGIPDETTNLHNPELSSTAIARIVAGQSATDTAYLEGTWPAGSSVVFSTFRQADPSAMVCSDANLAWSSAEPIAIQDGVTEYTSSAAKMERAGTYAWVATVLDASGAAVRIGECGDPSEMTVVMVPPRLASTGAHGVQEQGGIGLVLLAVGSVLLVAGIVITRRRRVRAAAAERELTP